MHLRNLYEDLLEADKALAVFALSLYLLLTCICLKRQT